MIRYFLCNVIGTGKEDDRYRPNLIQSTVIKSMKPWKDPKTGIESIKEFVNETFRYPYKQWSAIYFPALRPYKKCLIKIEFDGEVELKQKDYIKEIITDDDWEALKDYNFTKARFGD